MTELEDVRPEHRFDDSALDAHLREVLPKQFSGGFRIRQFQGGQSNPTFLLQTGSGRYVLRKKPPGDLLPSAHLVEREYRVMAALADTPVPVPRMLHLCEDPEVIGTTFYVMAYVEGRNYAQPSLEELTPAERRAVYDDLADTLAALHRVDYEAVGLGDFGKRGGYIERQIRRWCKQYEASRTGDEDDPNMEALMAWLPENIPAADETAIVHGDYRLGNTLLDPEQPRIAAVLDWELSTLGHPLSDLAYLCTAYHLPPGIEGVRGLEGLDLEALGIPDEDSFVARYCRAAGREGGIPDWPFYIAFSLFRSAAILQGVYKRAVDGIASSSDALEVGKRASLMAEAAWREARRIG